MSTRPISVASVTLISLSSTVVGNSLGGWIATEFAVQHPEMVGKLVLVDAAGLAG
jgi:pimeloyl-ACP methyl ester carboxylesterase